MSVFTNTLDAVYNGLNVEVRFNFLNGQKPEEMPVDFTEIVIIISDFSNPSNAPAIMLKKIIMDDLNKFLADPNNLNAKYYPYTFVPEFGGKISSQILISAKVNFKGTANVNDISYPVVSLSIPTSPEAPTISLVNPLKFKINTGTGVMVDGDVILKVAPPYPSQPNTKCKVTVSGSKMSDPYYFNINTDAGNYSSSLFPLNISSYFPNDITPDSSVNIYLQYEGNDRLSELSNIISAKASVRLDAPVITAVTSMQDRKITVAGTVKQAPYTEDSASSVVSDKRIRMTILAVETQEDDEIVSEELSWAPTNQKDLAVEGISGPTASQDNVLFNYEISQVNGVDLKRTKAYRFVAVAHYGLYDNTKSINILAQLPDVPPKINQSLPSNMDKTGLCIELISPDVKWTNTQNTTVVNNVPVLTFTPAFTQLPWPPANSQHRQQMIISYSFSSKQKGQINQKTNHSPVYEIAPAEYWKVSNPLPEDEYTLEAKFEVYVPTDQFKYIQGTPATPLVKNESNYWVASLKTFTASVGETRSSSDVPNVKELSLYTQLLGTNNTRALVSSHKSHSAKYYEEKHFQVIRTEREMIEGRSTNSHDFNGTTRLSFDLNGTQTHVSVANTNTNIPSSLNRDHGEDYYYILYPNGANANSTPISITTGKIFTIRTLTVVLDLKSNVEIKSDWAYASHEVTGLPPMNAPTFVNIDDLPSDKPGYALRVFVGVDARSNLVNKPEAWGSEPVIPLSFEVELLDQNRDPVGSGPYTRTFTSDELHNYNAGFTLIAPLDIFGLTLVENSHVYARAVITYALESDKSKKSEGSGNNINATVHLIPPTIVVSNIKLTQNPVLPDAQGPRAVNVSGMLNLTVYADVDSKGLTGTIVQCYLKTHNGIGPHMMSLDTTDATGMRWKSGLLIPESQKNYQSEEISVFATNGYAKFPFAYLNLV
jgi:hypothetical protein